MASSVLTWRCSGTHFWLPWAVLLKVGSRPSQADRMGLEHPDRIAAAQDRREVVGFLHLLQQHGEIAHAAIEHRPQALVASGQQRHGRAENAIIGAAAARFSPPGRAMAKDCCRKRTPLRPSGLRDGGADSPRPARHLRPDRRADRRLGLCPPGGLGAAAPAPALGGALASGGECPGAHRHEPGARGQRLDAAGAAAGRGDRRGGRRAAPPRPAPLAALSRWRRRRSLLFDGSSCTTE